MVGPLVVARSWAYPVPPDEAFARTIAFPLETLFDKRYGPIPPIEATEQDGPWGTEGQVRTIRTTDGGAMQERLLVVDAPRVFRYEITGISGPMKPLIARVEGSWAFEPAGTGTKVTWAWTVHPASTVGRAAMPVFGRLWRGYARQALERLEHLLLAPA